MSFRLLDWPQEPRVPTAMCLYNVGHRRSFDITCSLSGHRLSCDQLFSSMTVTLGASAQPIAQ